MYRKQYVNARFIIHDELGNAYPINEKVMPRFRRLCLIADYVLWINRRYLMFDVTNNRYDYKVLDAIRLRYRDFEHFPLMRYYRFKAIFNFITGGEIKGRNDKLYTGILYNCDLKDEDYPTTYFVYGNRRVSVDAVKWFTKKK